MLEKTRAIVLHSLKYGDTRFIVDVLTETHGRLTFLVPLSKSAKGKMKRQYFQPLTLLEVQFDFRANQDFQRLKNVSVSYPYGGIPFSPIKLSISLFLAEFLLYSTRYEQTNQPLFDFVAQSLMWLDVSQGEIANFHLVFLMKLTLFLGLQPNLSDWEENCFFDLEEGCFVPHVPNHAHFLSIEDTHSLVKLFRLSYKTMHLYSMSRLQRNHCVEVIVDYYRLHIPNFPELKSLPVLKTLFA